MNCYRGHSLRRTLCSLYMSIQSTISKPLWPEFNLTLRMHPLKLSRIKIERDVDDSVDEKSTFCY